MRATPGRWLVVGEYRNRITADKITYAIRTGRSIGSRDDAPYTPAGAYETRIELVEDVTRIHARYIGKETAR